MAVPVQVEEEEGHPRRCLERRYLVGTSCWLALLLLAAFAQPAIAAPINSSTQAMMYLSQFGYMDPKSRNPSSSAALISGESLIQAIKEFQAFAGLNQTGELDEDTIKMMNMPRCGVKDKVGFGTQARRKRYALQGSRWRVKELTYKISKYPARLRSGDVDLEVKNAFEVWSTYTDLKFVKKNSGRVHIEIRFEKGEHGDGDPFDGPGGTLAHAYFPVYGGDAHFDDSESWSINSFRGTNLFQVAAHEFGHSLGLSHSDVKSALMAPFYRGYETSFQLDEDDVKGIQSLYGKKTTTPTKRPGLSTTKSPKLPEEDGELCNDASIDAITTGSDGETYAFKGNNYWKLTEEGIASGYPQLISSHFPGLPGSLDAAFSWSQGRMYFFKGSEYWRFTNMKMDSGYPKPIKSGFDGIPDNIDAAFVWSGNGKIYFFKGSKFWRFDPTQRPAVKSTYPKEIKNWEGLPNNIDDALQYTNGYTYFFKGGKYWRFNDRNFAVEEANPAFPRPAGYWWFGCRTISAGLGRGNLEERHNHQQMEDDVDDSIMDAGHHHNGNGSPDFRRDQRPPQAPLGSAEGNNAATDSFRWNPFFLLLSSLPLALSLRR